MRRMLPFLLSGFSSTRLFVDGLDECEAAEWDSITKSIRSILTETNKATRSAGCKAIIFSRDTRYLETLFQKDTTISLRDEAVAIRSSIRLFVQHEMLQVRENFDDGNVDDEVLAAVEQKLVERADGKFVMH